MDGRIHFSKKLLQPIYSFMSPFLGVQKIDLMEKTSKEVTFCREIQAATWGCPSMKSWPLSLRKSNSDIFNRRSEEENNVKSLTSGCLTENSSTRSKISGGCRSNEWRTNYTFSAPTRWLTALTAVSVTAVFLPSCLLQWHKQNSCSYLLAKLREKLHFGDEETGNQYIHESKTKWYR